MNFGSSRYGLFRFLRYMKGQLFMPVKEMGDPGTDDDDEPDGRNPDPN